MYFLDLQTLPESPDADHAVGETLAPGVHIERRLILKLGLFGAAGLLLPGCLGTGAPAPAAAGAPLSVDEMIAILKPRAKELVTSPVPDEDAYLRMVAGILARVRQPAGGAPDKPVQFDPLFTERPLVVYQIRMNPGATIPLHDHRHYNGVIMGLSGDCRCQYYDILPPPGGGCWPAPDDVPPKGTDFTLRRTRDCVLSAGVIGSLSRRQNNIHELVAGPQGAQLLDVFTFFAPNAGSHWIDRSGAGGGEDGRVVARWR